MESPAAKIGRPTIYTDELAERIAQRHETGESLRRICASEGMPSWHSVWRWQQERPSFRSRLVRARQIASQALAEEAHDRLREVQGTESMAEVGAARELARSAQWLAERYDRDTYGQRTQVEHTVVKQLTDDEIKLRLLEAAAQAHAKGDGPTVALIAARAPEIVPTLRARGLLSVETVTPPCPPGEDARGGGSPLPNSGALTRKATPQE